MLVEHIVSEKMKWVETNHLTHLEKETLEKQYHLPLEVLDYVTDIYEQSSYIHDIANLDLLVIHIPIKLDQTNRYISRPISFVVTEQYLLTFNETENTMNQLWSGSNIDSSMTAIQLMIEGVNQMIAEFIPVLRDLTKQRHVLDDLLTKNVSNRDLVKLSYLQQSLTFLESAANSNLDTLEMMLDSPLLQRLTLHEQDRLKDAVIEAKQIKHMVDLESKIVTKISQIFDSIMNNNLNDTMKFLTIWSLAIAIPTLITGFYGMNIEVPMLDVKYGWVYLIIISILLVTWLMWALKKSRKM